MSRAAAVVIVVAAAAVLTTLEPAAVPEPTSTPEPATTTSPPGAWVILGGSSYSGPRGGGGTHYVTCVPEGSTREAGPWREIVISAELATRPFENDADDPLPPGAPCPDGPERR